MRLVPSLHPNNVTLYPCSAIGLGFLYSHSSCGQRGVSVLEVIVIPSSGDIGIIMENTLTIATVLKPQGIRGEIKVKALTDAAEDLKGFARVFIDGVEYKVLVVRPSGDCAYLTLRGIADRNAAELLRGKEVVALREDAPALPEDTFYLVDVLGCEVVTEKGKSLGTIIEITPAKTDIYVIEREGKRTTFVAAEGVIDSIDVEKKVVVVNKKRFDEVAL